MQADPFLDHVVSGLANVPGVEGIVLGGSRARGTAHLQSDYDVGLYYSATRELDIGALLQAATALAGSADAAGVTPVGGWGPWIVGGAWLSIDGRKVDLLYRNVEAVAKVIADCRAGRISIAYQPGHPRGFCSAIWMGEIALCQPLHDPAESIARLKASAVPYPQPLGEALIRRFQWEILFSIENAELTISRGEQTHVAGCAYRALACVAQVLFALNARYLINEKGALQEAAAFPLTIAGLMPRVADIWRLTGGQQFGSALALLRGIEQDTKALTQAFQADRAPK